MKYRVHIHDIKEFVYEVEADDELAAYREGEALFEVDGGCQGDFYQTRVVEDKR